VKIILTCILQHCLGRHAVELVGFGLSWKERGLLSTCNDYVIMIKKTAFLDKLSDYQPLTVSFFYALS
jgi:hypothetical protein